MRRRVAWGWLAVGGAAGGALVLFGLVPLGLVLVSALQDAGAPLWEELGAPGTRAAWLNTVLMSAAVTLVAVPAGGVVAWLVERTDFASSDRGRAWITGLFALPLAVPPYLLAMAWALLGNGRNGLFNRVFSVSWIDLYGFDGIVLVLATSASPFVMLAVRASLRQADPSLEEAARVSGAGPWQVVWQVTLPLTAPALAASGGLVFVFATASFGVPYVLGSVAEPPVLFLTTRIYQYTTLGGEHLLGRAAALAMFLLVTSLAAQGAASWLARRRSAVQVSGKSARPALVRLGRSRPALRIALGAGAFFFIALPLLTIAATSLWRSFADPGELTLQHWVSVLGRGESARAFLNSVLLALGAGACAAALGLVLALVAKKGGRPGTVLALLGTSPYAVPGTVLAIGLIVAFSQELRLIVLDQITFALYLPGTLALLLVAYAVKYLAFGIRGARAALDQIHPSLEEAARTSGATPLRGTWDVVVPLVSPAVAAAFLVVALPCMSELTMSVLLFGAGTETAGTLLFELQSYADPPAASVVATLVVVVAVAGDLLARRLQELAALRRRA